MVYDARLAERIRERVSVESGVDEKKMFGGLAFLVEGNMAIAASGQGGLMVRVDPEESEELVAGSAAEPMVMRGRAMAGWLRVPSAEVEDDAELERWIRTGVGYARSLHPNRPEGPGMTDAFILGGVRTPVGKYGGSLSHIRTDELLGSTMVAACEKAGVPLERVEDITGGCVNPAHEGMGDIARWGALAAGFPDSVP